MTLKGPGEKQIRITISCEDSALCMCFAELALRKSPERARNMPGSLPFQRSLVIPQRLVRLQGLRGVDPLTTYEQQLSTDSCMLTIAT